jgi:hypothetical protein
LIEQSLKLESWYVEEEKTRRLEPKEESHVGKLHGKAIKPLESRFGHRGVTGGRLKDPPPCFT